MAIFPIFRFFIYPRIYLFHLFLRGLRSQFFFLFFGTFRFLFDEWHRLFSYFPFFSFIFALPQTALQTSGLHPPIDFPQLFLDRLNPFSAPFIYTPPLGSPPALFLVFFPLSWRPPSPCFSCPVPCQCPNPKNVLNNNTPLDSLLSRNHGNLFIVLSYPNPQLPLALAVNLNGRLTKQSLFELKDPLPKKKEGSPSPLFHPRK